MSTEAEKAAFKEKLKSLHFGVVPGGYRESASTTMYDKDAFLDQFGDSEGSLFGEERVRDNQSTALRKLKEWEDLG